MINIFLASTDFDFETARSLFEEYAASLKINLSFQHFDDELKGLKKMYAQPSGGIILVKEGQELMGCVAVRRINKTECELKRMYVKPLHQNKGIGKLLLQGAISLAKQNNYTAIKLDTLNHMLPAIQLYKQAGFNEIPAYYYNPISTAIYFEKVL